MSTNAIFSNENAILQKEICLVDRKWTQSFAVDISCNSTVSTNVNPLGVWVDNGDGTWSTTINTVNGPVVATAEILTGTNLIGGFNGMVSNHLEVNYANATTNQRTRIKLSFDTELNGLSLSFNDLDITPGVLERVINSTIGLPSSTTGQTNAPTSNVSISPNVEDAVAGANWTNLPAITEMEFEVLYNGSSQPWTDQWGFNISSISTCASVVDVMHIIRGTRWDGVQEFFYPPQEYQIGDINEVNQWVAWFNGLGIGVATVTNDQPRLKTILIVDSPLKLDSIYHSPSGIYVPNTLSGFNNLGENYVVTEEVTKLFNVTSHDSDLTILDTKYFDQWNNEVEPTIYQELMICNEMSETNILLQQLVNCICCDDYSYLSGLAIGSEWL